ncbi:putative RNA polymerase II transcription subunit 31 mediator [Colletotrichum sublineola]|uniref:Mediator of RNA polymerase II transcription subunit 31 n=1 Tax=Colletotrichum sublineola TaxID=1173701 RepID=A0A066X1R3_COLSU|nr:putative RNA polymerase II transcription subunit 31 mediator [Colletotrichum sublineola]
MANTAPEQAGSPPPPPSENEPVYGGFTRFEIELEVRIPFTLPHSHPHPPTLATKPRLTRRIARTQFVQSLANPLYLNHLATQKLLTRPDFVAYLAYLQYWSRPPYLKYLMYPGPTLKHLELLQQEQFRMDIISPDLVQRLIDEGMKAAIDWHRSDA